MRASDVGRRSIVALAIPVLLAALAFRPILGNYFHADDFVNLFQIQTMPLGEYLSQEHGGHMLVIRNLVFWLSWHAFGTDPRPYFAIALGTHLVNVALLALVVRRFTGRAGLASLVAVLWATLPVNEQTLGWYAVYGQVLAATFLLVILADLARVAGDGGALSTARAAFWSALLLAGSACFGVGIGATAAFGLAAVLLLPGASRSRGATVVLAALPLAVVALYAAWNVVRVEVYGASPGAVVALVGLLRYWTNAAAMLVHLLGAGTAELVLGGLTGAGRYPGRFAYAVIAAVAVAAAVVAAGSRVAARRLAALLVLAVGMYAVIAAGRAMVYLALGKIEPAAAAAVGRYHYAAVLPLAVLLAVVLDGLQQRLRIPTRLLAPAVAALLLAVVIVRARTPIAFDHHDYARQETDRVLDAIRAAIAATPPGGDVWIRNREFPAVRYFFGGSFLGWASVFVVYFRDDVVDGRRVHFVETDRRLAETVGAGRSPRLAALLTAEAPAAPLW